METNVDKVKIAIDGKEVLADQGTSILDAARQSDIRIPTLCYHSALSDWGGCRICVVEVDGSPKLAASCVTPVRNGMVVVTSNDKIIESRRMILEYLFAERNHNCMFCPQSGDCELQELAYEMQMDHLTVPSSFNEFPTDVTSEYLAIDHNRCILCGRCVRACQEISGARVLNFNNRGPKNLIGFDLGEKREDSTCYDCGVCLQVCPTGAIYNRYRTHYAVKGHDKAWDSIESFCPRCGLLCPTISCTHDNNILKIEGKLTGNSGPGKGQLCYRGRFEVFKTGGQRLLQPMVRNKEGKWTEESWENALDLIAQKFRDINDKHGSGSLFGMASSECSNESLLFFRDLVGKGPMAGPVDTFDGRHFRNMSGAFKEVGGAFREAAWNQIQEADFVLMAGANPRESQPLIASLLRQAMFEKGTGIAVIGDGNTMSPFTSYPFPVEDKDVPLLIRALLCEVLASSKHPGGISSLEKVLQEAKTSNVEEILTRVGLDGDNKIAFHQMVKAFREAKNPLIIVGGVVTGSADVFGLSDALALASLKGFLPENRLRLILLKPQGNSAGAWKLGLASDNDFIGSEKLKGCLILLGGEDITDTALLHRLKGMDFVAAFSPYLPESLSGKVHVLLPIPLWMEESGTYTSLDGCQTAFQKKLIDGPAGVKNSWEAMCAFAEKIGLKPDFKTWDDLSLMAGKQIHKV